MKQSTKRILFTTLTAIFLLAACAPAPAATPNAAEVANQVATSVALTVESQNLDTAQAASAATSTPLPTSTPAVVDTPTLVLPTATPFVLVPPTTVPASGGSSGNTKPDYACDVIRQRPFDNTIFKPGAKFDIKWTILNVGTKTMNAGLDVKFSGGTKFMPNTIVELPELKPGGQFAMNFDGTAPSKEGTYVMRYIVEGGLCYPYVLIKVEK